MGENSSLTPVAGHLYVVATPIGNLADLSQRASSILCQCSLIACEDTRVSRKLLSAIGSDRPTVSYRDANEQAEAIRLADRLDAGESIALVCDAGTPTISDPGFRLVRECRKRGIPVVPVPGPAAMVTALMASGLPTDGFLYLGFLPPKKAARLRTFEKFKDFEYTLVFYESCHRIEKFIADAIDILGPERVASLGRELTKQHETFLVGSLSEIQSQLTGKNLKGEFVVIVGPSRFCL